MPTEPSVPIIDEPSIESALAHPEPADRMHVRDILEKATALQGLDEQEVATLVQVQDPELLAEVFAAARGVKETIYGPRLVIFAPLYISNFCGNNCLYCAFRAPNKSIVRRALTQEEIEREVEILVDQGHKRVLLVSGEAYPPREGFRYVLDSVDTIYRVKRGTGEIRRVNVNIAPLTVEQFRELKQARIGTYQLFQETYHRATYRAMHPSGPKKDYDWRVTVMDRAMEGGIDDVGLGVLFGLYDWRFEVLALMQHARHLERRFGCGPHTISVPRIEPAEGSTLAQSPPHAVSDDDFRKLIAILRLAVPYTGIILSTRETAELRRDVFALGISQISAGSRTDPGGYGDAQGAAHAGAQFQLGDHRSLDEVVRDVAALGYVPSFCTACYRLGRTGRDFMDLARPGAIKNHCDPNAVSTFLEYLIDFGSPETVRTGEQLIEATLQRMNGEQRATTRRLIEAVRAGKRDRFV